MKEKLIAYLERLNNRQVILRLSGLIVIPIILILGSTYAYGRFISPGVIGKGAVDLAPLPVTLQVPIMPVQPVGIQNSASPVQENFMPVLLSNDPISLDPEIGGGREDLGEIATQPTQPGIAVLPTQPTQSVQPVQRVQEGWPLPSEAKSTSGPTPPPGINRGQISMQAAAAKILDVPGYLWYRGCGPTAAGMLLGYWDSQGYSNLVTDGAMTQTDSVNAMIASTQHYDDYSLPLDASPGPILADKSELPAGDEHVDNSVADIMQTSQSVHSLYYGWSYFDRVDDALNGWVQLSGAGSSSTRSITMNDEFNWTVYKAEIDAGRPVVMLVDTDGDNATDHFATAIGYSEITGSQMYGVRDTWDTNVHWYNFAKMALGQSWGIYGGILFNISSTITGTIKDTLGVAIAGVTVSTNTGVSVVTNASGVYTLSGLTPGTYTITAVLAGYIFSPSTRTVTVPPSITAQDFTGTKCTQLVINGDFETNTGWTLPVTVYPANYDSSVTLDVTAQYSMEMVHGGTRSVRAGIVDATKNVYSYSSAWQQITIPAGVNNATLKFWLYPLSKGAVEGTGGDLQLMIILDSNKVEKERLVMLRSDERIWKSYQFDLKKYAGQTIWIYFGVYNNGWGSNMAMYVDDVSLESCNP